MSTGAPTHDIADPTGGLPTDSVPIEQDDDAMQSFGYDPDDPPEEDDEPVPEYFSGDPDDEEAPSGETDATPGEPGSEETVPTKLSREGWADYGLTEDQAKGLDASGQLGSVMDAFDKKFIAESVAAREPAPGDDSTAPAPEPAAGDPVEGPIKMELDVDDYGEDLHGHLGATAKVINQQAAEIAEMKEMLTGVMGHAQAQQAAAYEAEVDTFFDGISETYGDVFGKGKLSELPEGGAEATKRIEVSQAAVDLEDGFKRRGQPVPGRTELFNRAVRSVAGDKAATIAREEVATQVRNSQGQFAAKPTHRKGPALTGDERAESFSEEFYRKKGML